MTMNLQVPLCLFVVLTAVATGQKAAKNGCDGPVYKINNAYYIREDLKNNINSVDSLSFDHSTNTLYLSFQTDEPDTKLLPAKINLNTNEFQTIDGVVDAQLVSVDEKTNDVYIAGRKAIYKYIRNNNKVEPLVTRNFTEYPNFHMLYSKNVLYFSGFPSWTVYKVENGEVTKFKDLESTQVENLVFDKDDSKFFTNKSGLFKQNKGNIEVSYEDLEDFEIAGLSIDNVGNIYATTREYGLYVVKKSTNKVEKVFDDTAIAVTFDVDNNMIYSDNNNLYRLKSNTDPQCI